MNFLSVIGGGGKTLGLACAVAIAAFAATATEWTYYAKDAEGSPYSTAACITDGNWVLQVNNLDASTGTITFGKGNYNTCIQQGEGVLDLRGTFTVNDTAYEKKIINADFARYYTGGITEFYADNVTSVGSRAFQNCKTITTASISGTFDIIGGACFNGCSALTNVVLNSKALATIGSQAFQEPQKLTAIEITSDLAVTVNNTAVNWNNPLTSLTINGPVWETANVDNILAKNEASTTAKMVCTIYANSEKWSSLAATLTEAEEAVKPKKCFGVYREGSRKAWLVANNEKRGFAIIVR